MHYAADQSTGASARKAEANRANAQKSTGPATEAGKSRSSQNAKRHGLLAGTATLLAEPSQELQDLLTKYNADFRPADAHQEMLVRELAVADFRIKQIDRIELGFIACQTQAAFDRLLEDANRAQSTPEDPEPVQLSELGADMQTLMMGAALASNPAAFALLARYHAQARRDYYRALKQLEQVRTGKAAYLPEKSADETNPPQRAAKAAAAAAPASQKYETNPDRVDFALKWSDPNILFIPSLAEFREILGPYKGNDYFRQFEKTAG